MPFRPTGEPFWDGQFGRCVMSMDLLPFPDCVLFAGIGVLTPRKQLRYVVLGPQREFTAGEPTATTQQGLQGVRYREGRGTSRSQTNISFDGGTYLSVYKGPVRVTISFQLCFTMLSEPTDEKTAAGRLGADPTICRQQHQPVPGPDACASQAGTSITNPCHDHCPRSSSRQTPQAPVE